MTEGTTNTNVDYLGGFQYTNEILEFFPTAEGYVTVNTNQLSDHYNYVFNYTDHTSTPLSTGLGNIRLKYTAHPQTGEPQSLEENHYYPFGLTHDGYQPNHKIIGLEGANVTIIPTSTNVNDPYKYKFGGKEYQDEFDINTYDFGARNYDPALGRWMNMDPITHHSQSPYTAFDNNPVYFTDPEGKSSQPPTKNIKVTIITSVVDKNNNTTITQTTYDNTYTKNSDGSMSVTSSKSEISNTVSGDGQISKGSSISTTTDSYNVGTDGQKSETSSSSDTRTTNSNDTHNAFGEWTDFVSDYNKSHNEVYNKDMINKTGEKTTNAFSVGLSVVPISILSSLNLTEAQKIVLLGVGGQFGIDNSAKLTEAIQNQIFENNKNMIIYGVEHIENNTIIKSMKSPINNNPYARKRVGHTSFQDW